MPDEPQTLDIQQCPICHRPSVDGFCRHCGYEMPAEDETPAVAPEAASAPDVEPESPSELEAEPA